jgi:hypothetical protein
MTVRHIGRLWRGRCTADVSQTPDTLRCHSSSARDPPLAGQPWVGFFSTEVDLLHVLPAGTHLLVLDLAGASQYLCWWGTTRSIYGQVNCSASIGCTSISIAVPNAPGSGSKLYVCSLTLSASCDELPHQPVTAYTVLVMHRRCHRHIADHHCPHKCNHTGLFTSSSHLSS